MPGVYPVATSLFGFRRYHFVMIASLTRSLRFRARHHYWRTDWSDAENRRVFGENVHPHEHDYGLDVTVTGEVDERTGFVVDLGALDGAIEALVAPLRGRDLLEAIPGGPPGAQGMMPSTENLARWFFEQLEPRVPAPARLLRVRVSESATLSSEVQRPDRR
jgi:6-pyruvoyltetrahydropterin/6-carboxytetrahydropterin synthase